MCEPLSFQHHLRGLERSLYRCVSVCTQGKSFIKDALKCMAHGLRHKFSCISRKCVSIKEMVFQLQRECYIKHNLCSAAKENVAVMVEMIHFQDLFPKGWVVGLDSMLECIVCRSVPSFIWLFTFPGPSLFCSSMYSNSTITFIPAICKTLMYCASKH